MTSLSAARVRATMPVGPTEASKLREFDACELMATYTSYPSPYPARDFASVFRKRGMSGVCHRISVPQAIIASISNEKYRSVLPANSTPHARHETSSHAKIKVAVHGTATSVVWGLRR